MIQSSAYGIIGVDLLQPGMMLPRKIQDIVITGKNSYDILIMAHRLGKYRKWPAILVKIE